MLFTYVYIFNFLTGCFHNEIEGNVTKKGPGFGQATVSYKTSSNNQVGTTLSFYLDSLASQHYGPVLYVAFQSHRMQYKQ